MVAKAIPINGRWSKPRRPLWIALGIKDLDWTICYQSRVGPLKWLEPATDAEIRRAGREGKGVIVAPIAFVSEHSETLVELDIEYGKLAREAACPIIAVPPRWAPMRPSSPGLARLVRQARRHRSEAGTHQ